MDKSDFISWDDDDLNLDLLLGEYTDQEISSKCHQDFKPEEVSVLYRCPSCSKTLKSMSGFRGHVTKKHGLNVKASDHRQVNNEENREVKREDARNAKIKANKSEWIQKNIFDSIFSSSYKEAINEIGTSPIHNLFGKSPISEIAYFCENLEVFELFVKKCFAMLAAEPVNLMLTEDRENLFRKIHELRLSSDIREMELILQQVNCPCPDEINNFLQIFMMELTSAILKNLASTMKNESTDEAKTLSENDQKVLFYVSGFVLHALKKRYNKIKQGLDRQEMLTVIQSMTAKQCNENFVKKYASLLEKKNRGGLQHPCDNFFLLLRSMEIVTRKHTSGKLSSHALSKCALKEHIMESYMVKHYMEKLVPTTETSDESEEPTKSPLSYLEDITSLFLTVRGFAIARVERNKISNLLSQLSILHQTRLEIVLGMHLKINV